MAYGDKIILSSFDGSTGKIGPYNTLVNLNSQEPDNYTIPTHMLYRLMLADPECLIMTELNNFNIISISRTATVSIPFAPRSRLDAPNWEVGVYAKEYEHIGYVRTFGKYKTVTQLPQFLLREKESHAVLHGEGTIEDAIVNPPLSLYKELLNNSFTAVYQKRDGHLGFYEKELHYD